MGITKNILHNDYTPDDEKLPGRRVSIKTQAVEYPIAVNKGGTGASTAAAARKNLGLGSVATEDIVPIQKGGTGSTTVDGARENIGAAAKPVVEHKVKSMITSTSWFDTGLSFSVPANTIYGISVKAQWDNNKPVACVITTENINPETRPDAVFAMVNGGRASVSGYANGAITLYFWAKYAGESNNSVMIDYWRISV